MSSVSLAFLCPRKCSLPSPSTVGAALLALGSERGGKEGLPRFLGIDWGNLGRVDHNDYAIDWDQADVAASLPRRSGMMVLPASWANVRKVLNELQAIVRD